VRKVEEKLKKVAVETTNRVGLKGGFQYLRKDGGVESNIMGGSESLGNTEERRKRSWERLPKKSNPPRTTG